MTGMMYTTGMAGSGFLFLWGVHILSVIVFFTGLLFLILWAAKNLTAGQLKTWGIGLLVIGTVACLFTIGVRGGPWTNGGFGWGKSGMMPQRGMMNMAMMLQGKTGDAFDLAFIEGMIPHHQGAIDMAEMALENAKHDEIKAMARAIITAQQREIDQMEQWMDNWGYTE